MTKLTLGQKVHTIFGYGEIYGFEDFDEAGMCLPIANEDKGNRVVVKLDEPDNWVGSKSGQKPHFNRYEITVCSIH